MSFHAGFVGIIGQPNSGKSTLINRLVQEKISIVNEKPQTTRRRILGIVNQDGSEISGQVIFVDAPGILNAKKGLNKFLAQEAQDVCESSDALMLVLSVDEKEASAIEAVLKIAKTSHKPWFVVINKVDKIQFSHRIQKIRDLVAKYQPDARVFEMSETWKRDGEDVARQIVSYALTLLPIARAPLYDAELYTPHSERELITEMIREACFTQLKKELPYSIAVRVVKIDEESRLPKIHAEILVSRESHKPIVIGKEAKVIKKIGKAARTEIEKMMGQKVFLGLEVVVRENWFENKRLMKELGYAQHE